MKYNNLQSKMINTTKHSLRTIFAFAAFLFLGSGMNVWGDSYTLSAGTFDSDKKISTVGSLSFSLDLAHGGTGQTGYSEYIKLSSNKTYTITLPDGFNLTNINIKGYTNKDSNNDGEITEIGGVSQTSKTFPAKNNSSLSSHSCITDGYDFPISQTGGTVAIKTKKSNQICVLITLTGTPAGGGSLADCSPTIDASCLADAWAQGIDYMKNAPATISWTAMATANSGDASKLHYKWYRYPVEHPEAAEDAEGTNDQATFSPDPTDAHDWMEYYCRVTEDGCSGYADTHVTGAVRVQSVIKGWIVFEGQEMTALASSPVSYTGSPSRPGTITYSTVGVAKDPVDVSSKTNKLGNGKTYSKGIQLSKSAGGYLSFTIPDGYTATFTYAFSGTGKRTIMLASKAINSTTADGYIATLTDQVPKDDIGGGEYTTPLAAGTYYICEGGSGNWQIVELIFDLQPAGADCAPTITTGSAVGWAGGAVYTKGQVVSEPLFTVVATASNGGTLKYKWKSFPVPGGSKATAVDAAGTNDQASYTPPTDIVHEDYIYFCEVSETGCSGKAETELTGAVRVNPKPVTGWIIFDGSTDDAARDKTIKYWNGTAFDDSKVTMTYDVKGSWSTTDIGSRTQDVNDKTYLKAYKAGGTTSGSNNYLQFTIPDGYTATFDYMFATGSNNAVYKLGTTINGDEKGTLTTFPSSGATKVLQGGTYSTPLTSGTYYLGNSNTIHIAELIFYLVEDDCTPPTNTSDPFGGKGDYKVGDVPTLSFTASATPANGGAISYQWYQNTTGSTVGAVVADLDANGSNTSATYTPRTDVEGTHYYFCEMKEAGCSKATRTALSGVVTVTDPCNSWGYGTSNTGKLTAKGTLTVGDMTIRSAGSTGATTTTVEGFSGSGSLAYIINLNSGDKYITADLGGNKIKTLRFGVSTKTTNTTLSLAFSSASPFDADKLLDYTEGMQIHIITDLNKNDAEKKIYTITVPKGTKSVAVGRNFNDISGTKDGTQSNSGDRFLYYLSLCPDDDCTPDFTEQPTAVQTVAAGESVTLSVNSDEATNFAWFSNTVNSNTSGTAISGATDKTYTFTAPTTAGTYYYYCNIMVGTCPSNSSNVATVIVKDGCEDQEIIKATLTSKTAATVSGTIGGTASVSLGSESGGGYKVGSDGQYFMITLADGNFQEGDVINFEITAKSGSDKLYFYSSKSAAGKFAEVEADAAGTYSYTLTASDISTYSITNTIGTYRESSDNNPYLKSISVERLVCYCTPPTITAQPTGATICSDETHTLSVTATGATAYKWYKDGVLQAGKTAASFATNEAGEWYCEVYSGSDCYARSQKVTISVKTAVTASWVTAPADASAGAPNMTVEVTSNYVDDDDEVLGLTFSSSNSAVASVNATTGEITYLTAGTTTITATVTGAGDYCGTATADQIITVAVPACDEYSFHYGTRGSSGWQILCFEQVGTSTTYLSPLFTIPTDVPHYYVGWKGSWNADAAKSANADLSGMPYATSGSNLSKTLQRHEAGNVGGAQGYLRIFSDSGDGNKYVGFVPAGYGMRLGSDAPIAFTAASSDKFEINWATDIVTLTSAMLSGKYDVRLKTADGYVWAEGRSSDDDLAGMQIKTLTDTWRATGLQASDADSKGKFAIYANSGDNNWYCYFIPYIGITFDLNGGDSWAGTAPDLVAINAAEAERTVAIPTEKPVRQNYNFIGWNTDPSATTATYAVSTDVVLTADLKLYAIWQEKTLQPIECDVFYKVEDIAAEGAISGNHYAGGFSQNEHFFIVGDQSASDGATGTPEQKAGTATIDGKDFTNIMYLKGAAQLVSDLPTSRAVKFIVPEQGRLTLYTKDGKNIRLIKEGSTEAAVVGESGNGKNMLGVTAGTYYIYATKGSTQLLGIKFTCCPTITKYTVSADKSSICPGENVTVTLSGSQVGVDYQLFSAGLKVGEVKEGTGSALTWTLDEPGNYVVQTALDWCNPVLMDGSANIVNLGASISGLDVLTEKELITLTASKIGGTWSVSNDNVVLGTADESDGEHSVITLTGAKAGTTTVSYTLGGCKTTHELTINEFLVCVTFDAEVTTPHTYTVGSSDLTITKIGNSTGKPSGTSDKLTAAATSDIKKYEPGYDYTLSTFQRFSLSTSVATTKIILYAYYGLSTIIGINKIALSETGADKSYTDYTKGTKLDWTVEYEDREPSKNKNFYKITINAVGDYFIPANQYLFIDFSGSGLRTYKICFKPVDCDALKITAGSSTTLDVGHSVKLTPSQSGGVWDVEKTDVVSFTDNGDGSVNITAKSINPGNTSDITYNMPNGCSTTLTITVNADPCPEPTVQLYTATEQTLAVGAPLVLAANATAETGTLTYQWYRNSTATIEGAANLPSATVPDFRTETLDGENYYFLEVTNTVGESSKKVYSDFIHVRTLSGCENRAIIFANTRGTNKTAVEADADGGTIGGTRLEKMHNDRRFSASGEYFFLRLASGNYQAGDQVKILITSNNKNLYLFYAQNDASYLPTQIQCARDVEATYTLTAEDISRGVTNMIGLYRPSSAIDGSTQNPYLLSLSVERPYCYQSTIPLCTDDGAVNLAACEIDPASGYTYEWKINGGAVVSTSSEVNILPSTADQTVRYDIMKGGTSYANYQHVVAGDGTDFNFSLGLEAYFKGMTDELIPTTYGGTWEVTCNASDCDNSPCVSATVEYVGGKYIFTPLASNYTLVTLTYSNEHGCSHSKTISASNPYFVFNAATDNKWSTVSNWYVSTNSNTYAPRDKDPIPNCLPTIENRVILLDSCVVDYSGAVADYVRLAHGTAGTVEGKGKLVILPTGGLTVQRQITKFEADGTKFGQQQPITIEYTDGKMTRCDLYIYSDESHVGALAFKSEDNYLPQAYVGYYLKAYYDKSAKKADWQYIGIPFSKDGTSFRSYFYGGYVQEWAESANNWTQVQNNTERADENPDPFVGYAFTQALDPAGYSNNQEGKLNPTKDMTFNLDFTNSSLGFNILANSWTSPIYINASGDGVDEPFTFTNADATFYLFATGDYDTWSKKYRSVTINPEGVTTEAMPGQYYAIPVKAAPFIGRSTIAPMQGFFVHATGAGAQLTINHRLAVQNLAEPVKVTSPRLAPAKAPSENIKLTTIELVGDNGGDQLYILTGSNDFTDRFDNGWDARKMESIRVGAPYLAAQTMGGKFQISAQPQLLGTTLSFRAGEDEYYELLITTQEQDLMLKDMETGITVPLDSTTIYPFFVTNKSMSARFCFVKKPEVITSLETERSGLIGAYVNGNEVVVSNFTGESLSGGLYDMTGKLLQAFEANSELTSVKLPSQSGVYLIRLSDQTIKITL